MHGQVNKEIVLERASTKWQCIVERCPESLAVRKTFNQNYIHVSLHSKQNDPVNDGESTGVQDVLFGVRDAN